MEGSFRVLSISHVNAPLAIRELIALNEEETKSFYLKLKDVFDISEALVLSTCNRTEIYYKSEETEPGKIISLLAAHKGIPAKEVLSYFDVIGEELAAINYLFEVSLGLHSQVIGDLQIPNQIKHAYQWSADMQMAGPFLHRVMHTIFFANKRIVQETGFRDGAASTSYAAVELMEGFLPLINSPKILVLGLGEIGEDVCRTLASKGYNNITISNRTLSKAEKLAGEFGFEVLNFSDFEDKLSDFDIVISSVRSDNPVITIQNLSARKRKSITYLLDLSVPRSIQTDVEELSGVVVYDLDEIQKRANQAVEKRKAAIPAVKAIVAELVAELEDWSKEMIVSPTIQKLKNALEVIRKEELSRHVKSLNEEEIQKIDKITSSMMQKIIKLPVLQLKAACKRGEAETLIDVLNDLFNLEKDTVTH
ncbi:glutamyl-tRNA reductase [Emticicia sp. CRIBPO]|uniref:glutamyl-tRNA reductase n=1 Tax=Emticicia sp. CRIBPO TaxID=2683258 RepID=UPI00141320CB|nr:glutamyl-tRNA reductase [Emticicia sp. CRIBPO]NBA85422.1 glutamyl-tRNA reductase [Emticicia sp. CRIBPO]